MTESRVLSLALSVAAVVCLVVAAMCAGAAVDLGAPVLALPALGASGLTMLLVYVANKVHDEGRTNG